MITPNTARVLDLASRAAFAPAGPNAMPVPFRWPNKPALATLDYSLDLTAAIVPVPGAGLPADTIADASLTILPIDAVNPLTAGTVQIDGYIVTAVFSGGNAGEDYTVNILVEMQSGNVLFYSINLYVPVPQGPVAVFPS